MNDVINELNKGLAAAQDAREFLAAVRDWCAENSPFACHPVDHIRWVHYTEVQANDYNPNSVAKNEMKLLHTSISADGYTQPVVVIWDAEISKYVIIDGFHRYTTMRLNADIQATTGGYLPVVVLKKDINERMASTVRHNRARGKHSVLGMGNMVFQMLENGKTDEEICAELGLSADEIVRLKHVTGFSKLYENVEYRNAWEKQRQIKLRTDWQNKHGSLH